MAEIPPALKPFIGKYIGRATQMDSLEAKRPGTGAAKVAYYCRTKALTEALKDKSIMEQKDCQTFLLGLMDATEKAKAELGISSDSKDADSVRRRGMFPRGPRQGRAWPARMVRVCLPPPQETIRAFALNLFSAAEKDLREHRVSP